MWSMTEPANPPAVNGYKTIVHDCAETFDEQVNFFISKGWQPYGPPHTIISPASKTHLMVQVMVLYEHTTEKIPKRN